jgi:menaquinone-dependent protoporphyrinogen oxidase
VRELAQRQAAALAAAGLAVFQRPGRRPGQPADDPVNASTILESTKARDHQIFTGKLVKKHLSFPDRAIASATRVQGGGLGNWDSIRAWATTSAATLLAS